jgi:hypothetical protein
VTTSPPGPDRRWRAAPGPPGRSPPQIRLNGAIKALISKPDGQAFVRLDTIFAS